MEAILLNEGNWNDVFSGRHQFPFRASQIKQVNKELSLSPLSFKYNIRGKEVYSHQNQREILLGGDYLFITHHERCEVFIQEEHDDLGICIDVNPELLKQAIALHTKPNDLENREQDDHYWFHSDLFIRHRASEGFNHYMNDLFPRILNNAIPSLPSLEMDFITQFLQEQLPHFHAFQFIPLMKPQNKRELYQRLIQAKNKMQDRVYEPLSIMQLARESYMSEFRFYHMYKEVFGVSPHKEILRFKCEEALRLFRKGQHTWTEIALLLDFADLATFSKAFKRIMGKAPSFIHD